MKTTFTENEVLVIGFVLAKSLGMMECEDYNISDQGALTAAGIVNAIFGTNYVLQDAESGDVIA